MSLPQDLLQSLQGVTGFNEPAFKAVHESGEQVTAIRYHPVKGKSVQHDWSSTIIPWCSLGAYLAERPSFTLDPSFHGGAYYVQDASSMFLWQMLEQLVPNAGQQKILDLCAAPGGKSTLLASYFPDGLLVSNEVIKSRASILVENLTKWGSSNVVVTNNDPLHFQNLGAYFDLLVVDAPCSGSGLFRKDPDAITEWSLDHVQLCGKRQQRILADILPTLKDNGILIYATCSYSPDEDEMIADWLVDEMEMESLTVSIKSEWGIVCSESTKHKAIGYRFYPDQLKGEGFFIASFRKKGDDVANAKSRSNTLTKLSRQEVEQIQQFIPLTDEYAFFKQADQLKAIDSYWYDDLSLLAGNLYIRKAGITLGSIKGKDVIPAHELALSLLPLDHFNTVSLDIEQSLQYLRRQDLFVEATKGWNLVRFGELPIGWLKALPNRINNYYPQEWRILKR